MISYVICACMISYTYKKLIYMLWYQYTSVKLCLILHIQTTEEFPVDLDLQTTGEFPNGLDKDLNP